MAAGRDAVERNSDGSYDAVDSGGFGKDYHGQDAFGERIGGTGIGGSHFGGFEEGHFGVGDGRNHFERKATSYGDIAQTETMDKPDTGSLFDGSDESKAETKSDMKDSLRNLNSESSEENSKVGSMDTSFQIGGIEENEAAKEKMNSAKQKMDSLKQSLSIAEERKKEELGFIDKFIDKLSKDIDEFSSTFEGAKTVGLEYNQDYIDKRTEMLNKVGNFADNYGMGVNEEIREKLSNPATAPDAMREVLKDVRDMHERIHAKAYDTVKSKYDAAKSEYETSKDNYDKQLESSFTDRMKESKKSDYETKANKDSTKEVPKGTPSRNDFGNHAQKTFSGVIDKVSDSFTAKGLGLKSVEDFAKENGYDPNKLSTMRAYQAYQNKEIVKAIPGVLKQVGGYIVERIKDAFDPSQLPERVRNTLARYNAATLVGAAILSINSGAGLQASIDQALTMVDPEDQTAVSDFLEDVLKDRDTVKDLSNAVDGALAPEENSNTSKLDEEIVNIGRKNNTDYDDFNAGIGSTTSDADVKVFIARNIKADPILRRMVEKLGK